MRILAFLALAILMAGCADDGPATFRFSGQLDHGLSEAEQAEVRALAGKDFTVESTDVYCPPEVDPYDCNSTWLRVDEITRSRCAKLERELEERGYWRRAPTCDEPDYG